MVHVTIRDLDNGVVARRARRAARNHRSLQAELHAILKGAADPGNGASRPDSRSPVREAGRVDLFELLQGLRN